MNDSRKAALWLVLLAAAGTFALTMGTRQTMGLFLSPLNTATGLGLASISLAFAFGQLWWGLTQPFAGAMADKVGAGRVLLAGRLEDETGAVIVVSDMSTEEVQNLVDSDPYTSAGAASYEVVSFNGAFRAPGL